MSVRRETYIDPKTGMRGAFWRVDVKARAPDGKVVRVRRASSTWTKAQAKVEESRIRLAIREGTHHQQKEEAQREVPTLEQYQAEFLSDYAEAYNKPSEVASKESILRRHLVPFFGGLRLDTIGKRHIKRYTRAKQRSGLSNKSINNHLTVLRKLLADAVDSELIEHVPPIQWLKTLKPDFDFLTFAEAERLVDGAEDAWRPMIVTALKTGMRLGELRGLRWKDVDLKAGRIVVRQAVARDIVGTPKNHRQRELPLSAEALAVLKGHRHLRGEYVFCNEDGRLLTKGQTKWPLWRACERAELRRIGWHCLRHTFASHLVMRGVRLKAVQELMGHATIEMTMRYAHLSPDVRRDAVMLLDGPVPGRATQTASADFGAK